MMKSTTILLFPYLTLTTAAITTSIFVPEEYLSNTFDVSIAGAASSTTTYLFSPGCAFGPCGPVRLTQGPGTAIYTADNVPSGGVTTAWTCELQPLTGDPTTAQCTLTSTAPWGCCSGSEMKNYPQAEGYAFPIYEAVVVTAAGSGGIGGVRPTETLFTQSDPGAPATSTDAFTSLSSEGSVTSTSISVTGTSAASTASLSSAQTTDSSSVSNSQGSVTAMTSVSTGSTSSSSTAAADAVMQRYSSGLGSTIVGVISLLLGLGAL